MESYKNVRFQVLESLYLDQIQFYLFCIQILTFCKYESKINQIAEWGIGFCANLVLFQIIYDNGEQGAQRGSVSHYCFTVTVHLSENRKLSRRFHIARCWLNAEH